MTKTKTLNVNQLAEIMGITPRGVEKMATHPQWTFGAGPWELDQVKPIQLWRQQAELNALSQLNHAQHQIAPRAAREIATRKAKEDRARRHQLKKMVFNAGKKTENTDLIAADAEREKREALERRERWMIHAGIGRLHMEHMATLRMSSPWGRGLNRVRQILTDKWICVLHGARGTGKTQMAAKIVFDEIMQQRKAKILKATQILLDLRHSFAGTSESEKTIIDGLCSYPLLVIDELHEANHSDYTREKFTHIIDERYRYKMPTLIITNHLTANDIATALQDSVVSRLKERGQLVPTNWRSFREPQAGGAAA